jgi:DNA excision repair protein ERCC-5
MGVTGLWTVVQPCARPIKIEALNKKRLAIDASIWIYQFLKAVRDKDDGGAQQRSSHVVGFFRRVCKLLFIGIRPVFVFDGGAPALKRATINARKRRREGRREDAARTAGKLLALQLQRAAEEVVARPTGGGSGDEGPLPEGLVYADQRQQSKAFKKHDAYDLPALETDMAAMGQPNDPRIMSLEELQSYASHFNSGQDINLYDFSKIDFDGVFFQSLPDSDQYNILNAARLRGRLRMGYSKDQLDTMFPDRMAFSKFQIERVRERNELTQRLMRLLGMSQDGTLTMDGTARIAGERGREYVLVKNDGVEGGWALGVVDFRGQGARDKPIDVDEPEEKPDEDLEEEDEDFEDVPIVGLNRLPDLAKDPSAAPGLLASLSDRRQDLYGSRMKGATTTPFMDDSDQGPLFVSNDSGEESLMFIVSQNRQAGNEDEDEDLQRAIALSLQQGSPEESEEDYLEVFSPQKKREEPAPFFNGTGKTIGRVANSRAAKEVMAMDDSDDEIVDLRAELRRAAQRKKREEQTSGSNKPPSSVLPVPLPFEKIDLGVSIFDTVKAKTTGDKKPAKKPDAKTSFQPPWFSNEKVAEEVERPLPTPSTRQTLGDNDARFIFKQPSPRESDDDDVMEIGPSAETHQNEIPQLSHSRYDDRENVLQQHVDLTSDEVQNDQDPKPDITMAGDTDDIDSEAESGDWEDVIASPPSKARLSQAHEAPHPTEGRSGSTEMLETELLGLHPSEGLEDMATSDNGREDADISLADAGREENEFAYLDADEDELLRQLAQEDQEHERFASTVNNRNFVHKKIDYDAEIGALKIQKAKDMRDADEVTQTMISEVQELLSLFGLPYITAPMEAEAQCAELLRLGLVDGIVTDDSDIFLFGGTRVYKNMFNQAKLVECYLSLDLESEFGLGRDRLISIAQLLGSDYAEGMPGVGPVTALEILSEFDTLDDFKQWWEAVQSGSRAARDDVQSPFRKKFRRNSAKIFLPRTFPDPLVADAYLHPVVDSDPSAFRWGVPDLDALRSFLMRTAGWTAERTDEVLVPVVRDMNRREVEGTQSNITAFYQQQSGSEAFAPRRHKEAGSKRLRSALQRIGQKDQGQKAASLTQADDDRDLEPEEFDDEEDEIRSPKRRARKRKGGHVMF